MPKVAWMVLALFGTQEQDLPWSSRHRILHVHNNVPGVLKGINEVRRNATRAVVCQRSVHRTVLRAIQRAAVSNRSVSRRCWRTSTCRRRVCARLARSVRATYTAEALGIQRACRRRVCARVLGEIRSKPTACGRPPLAVGLGTHGSVPPCASGRPPLLAWLLLYVLFACFVRSLQAT